MYNVDMPVVLFPITSVGTTQASTPYIKEVLYTVFTVHPSGNALDFVLNIREEPKQQTHYCNITTNATANRREDIFKLAFGNENLHENFNY
jgi:hypothetical protein